VQVGRITNRYQTKLDKLLSIFEQTNFVDDSQITKEFIHEIDGIEMKEATDILHHTGTDPKEKKQIENEEEAWRTVDAMAGGLRNKLIEQTKKLEENNKKLEENAKSLEENAKSLEENAKSLEENAKSLEEKDKLIQELIRKLSEK
jgi:methyl-accepting chemotaxis protein